MSHRPRHRRRLFRRWGIRLGRLLLTVGRGAWRLARNFRTGFKLVGYALAHRFRSWWRRRKGWYLLQGMPAVLLAGGVVAMVVLVALHSRVRTISWYQQTANAALAGGNHAAARIAYERLALLEDGRPEHRFRLALAEQGLQNNDRALGLIRSLAPDDRLGYPPAHLYLGVALVPQGKSSSQALQLAETHLLWASRGPKEAVQAHALLGQLYFQTNRLEQAEPHLLKSADEFPELGLLLSAGYKARGQKEAARNWGVRTGRLFRDRAEANPTDHAARINWAQALLLLDDFSHSIEVLKQGLALSSAEAYRQELARAHVAWADYIQRESDDPGQRLVLLEEGLKYDPNNVELLKRLVKATRIEGPEADIARAALQALLAQGKASATLHLLLGMDATERGQAAAAREHLDQAYRLNEQMPVVANNLAWILATTSPVDLPRALELVNSALQRQPNDPRFRDTRGQVLARMGKWKEALTDLEAALPGLPKNQDLHRTLGEVYEHLGMPEMAEQHKKLGGDSPR